MKNCPRDRDQSGFSLIELMVAVGVLSILVAIAIPAYEGYVRESHLTAMRTTMNGMRTSIEEYRLDNGNYGSNATLSGIGQISSSQGGRFDWTPSGDTGNYTYVVAVTSTNSYDVWGSHINGIWARCDDRFQQCCDSDTTGSSTIVACP